MDLISSSLLFTVVVTLILLFVLLFILLLYVSLYVPLYVILVLVWFRSCLPCDVRPLVAVREVLYVVALVCMRIFCMLLYVVALYGACFVCCCNMPAHVVVCVILLRGFVCCVFVLFCFVLLV